MSKRRERTPEQVAEATAANIATADRIEAYVAKRREANPEERYSVRKLSVAAGMGPSQLGATLHRLRAGSDIGGAVLTGLASAMGISVGELQGEAAQSTIAPAFGTLPGWDKAVRNATARYMMRPEGLSAIAAWRPDVPPKGIDGALVHALYHAWESIPKA